jgi:hypothetical protein
LKSFFSSSSNCLQLSSQSKSTLKYSLEDISNVLCELVQVTISHETDVIDLLKMIPKLIYPLICVRGGMDKVSYMTEKGGYRFIKAQNFKSSMVSSGKYPRYMLSKKNHL